jgi:uncharacterized protein YndB with AHSA1/START domain
MKTKSDSSDSLVFECDFEEPPEKVWRALTEPRLLEAWLTTEEPLPAEPPRPDLEEAQPAPPQPRSDYEVLTAEPHRLVRYRWRDRDSGAGDSDGGEVYSVVTFELAPRPMGGTHLRLTHGEFTMVPAVAMAVSRVRPITSARRWKTPSASLSVHCCLRRAA